MASVDTLEKNRVVTPSAKEIVDHFKDWNLNDASRDYLAFHAIRYEFLLGYVDKIISRVHDSPVRILDIGESYLTELLRDRYPKAIVNTLGFGDRRFRPRNGEKQYVANLNDAQFEDRWIKTEKHDLIIMAEVIEHLHTSPMLVLKFLMTCMKISSYIIIQTPNACRLQNRIIMIRGRNPFEQIRINHRNPGHFREYTLTEMLNIGREVGLKCIGHSIRNYFLPISREAKAYRFITNLLPSTMREGITICFQKDSRINGVNLIITNIIGMQSEGFYNIEAQKHSKWRWTNGNAKIIIPIEEHDNSKPRKLIISIIQAMGMEFRLTVNDFELENTKLPMGPWSKTYSLKSVLIQDSIEIAITTTTFVPKNVLPNSIDSRILGVMLNEIILF